MPSGFHWADTQRQISHALLYQANRKAFRRLVVVTVRLREYKAFTQAMSANGGSGGNKKGDLFQKSPDEKNN